MRRLYVGTGMVALSSVALVLVLTQIPITVASSVTSRTAHSKSLSVTSFNDAKITAICDRLNPGDSLGLSKPTLVSRMDGVDAVIFATSTKYSACVVSGIKNVAENKPTPFVHSSKAIHELESFATLNKIPHRALYAPDTWFVVRVAPTVSTIKAVTRGSNRVSRIGDGFAFIHVKETVDVRGKFVYGVAAGFSAGGGLVGNATLS